MTDIGSVAPIFILSPGQSGTVWLADVMMKQWGKAALVLHEPLAEMDWVMSYHVWPERRDGDDLAAYLRATRYKVLYYLGKGVRYVEVNPSLYALGAAIRQWDSSIRRIGLFRDGRSVVRSGREHNWYRVRNHWEATRVRIEDHARWESLSHTAQCAWCWAATAASIIPECEMFLKLEDLVADDGYETWSRFCALVGMPAGNRAMYDYLRVRPKNASGRKVPAFDLWPDSEKADFWAWAEKPMEALGYGSKP